MYWLGGGPPVPGDCARVILRHGIIVWAWGALVSSRVASSGTRGRLTCVLQVQVFLILLRLLLAGGAVVRHLICHLEASSGEICTKESR